MKQVLCSLVLWSLWLVALGADSKVDPARLKTFSAIGKERPDLNGYKEAELLRHNGKGCLTHMWFQPTRNPLYNLHVGLRMVNAETTMRTLLVEILCLSCLGRRLQAAEQAPQGGSSFAISTWAADVLGHGRWRGSWT